MRILVVTQYFWPEVFRINDLVDALAVRGHKVTVLTGIPNYPGGKFYPGYGLRGPITESRNGVEILRVPIIPRGSGSRLRLLINYVSFALRACLAVRRLPHGRYDLIFVYEPSPVTVGLPAVVAKKRCGAPIMFWVQDLWPETLAAVGEVRSRWVLRWVERLVRFIYRHCDLILAQSRGFLPAIARLGVPDAKMRYFPNSAEALYVPTNAATAMAEQQLMPAGFRVMFAGNIGAAQDFETIVAAASLLKGRPDIHWVILGEGRMRAWVQSPGCRARTGRELPFAWTPSAHSMPRFFALADAMLVTLKRNPIFGLTIPAKVQSYLACARPIIAALDGEAARVVEESGAGLAVRSEDPGALAGAVLAMHEMSPAGRAAMGQRGRAYFEQHFERDMLLRRLDGWIAELTQTK